MIFRIRLIITLSVAALVAGCNKPKETSTTVNVAPIIENPKVIAKETTPISQNDSAQRSEAVASIPPLALDVTSEEQAKKVLDDYSMRPWEYEGSEAQVLSILNKYIADPRQRKTLIETLTIPFFKNNPQGFLEMVKSEILKSQEVLMMGTILEANITDGVSEDLLKLSMLLPEGRQGDALVTDILGKYSKYNLEGSLRFAQANFSRTIVSNAIREIYSSMEPEQFDSAINSLKLLGDDPELVKYAITGLSISATSVNIMSGYDWVLAGYKDNPAIFDSALTTTLLRMSHAAPGNYFSSLQKIESYDKRSEILEYSIPTLMGSPDRENFIKTIEQEYTNLLPKVAGNIVDAWVDVSSVEASLWILSLPSGEARDNAIYAFIRYSAEFNAKESTVWLDLIQNNDVRQNAQSHISAVKGK